MWRAVIEIKGGHAEILPTTPSICWASTVCVRERESRNQLAPTHFHNLREICFKELKRICGPRIITHLGLGNDVGRALSLCSFALSLSLSVDWLYLISTDAPQPQCHAASGRISLSLSLSVYLPHSLLLNSQRRNPGPGAHLECRHLWPPWGHMLRS